MMLLLGLLSLAAVLAFAVARPRGWPEAFAAVPAVVLLIAVGAISLHDAASEAAQLSRVVAFLGAVLVLAERMTEIFEGEEDSPYMLIAKPVRPEWRDKIPAIVHVDGTARVQTVREATNPRLYRLLKEFEALTGVPVLIKLAEGVSLEEGKAAVTAAARPFAAPKVQTRDEYMDDVAGQIDQMLTLVYGLLAVAIVIALGRPACATMCASRSCCLALSTSCWMPFLRSRSETSSDISIDAVPTSTGWPRSWLSLMSSAIASYFGPDLRKITSASSLRTIGRCVGMTTTSRP